MASAYPSTAKGNRRFLTAFMTDNGTAGGANGSAFVTPGFRGKIVKISSVIPAAIAGANAVITASIGTVAVTNGVVTILLSGSAAGDIASAVPTALNTFQATDYIKLVSDGGPSGVVPTIFTIECEIL